MCQAFFKSLAYNSELDTPRPCLSGAYTVGRETDTESPSADAVASGSEETSEEKAMVNILGCGLGALAVQVQETRQRISSYSGILFSRPL